MTSIEVYSDGSATTNDKPGGYGWVMVVNGQKHSEGSGHMPLASNNDAELEAAIQGLTAVQKALEFILLNHPSPLQLTLVSDSQLVLGWANGSYRFRQADKAEKFKQLQLLVRLMSVKTRWVEGHSGDEHNERCDKLANAGRLNQPVDLSKVKADPVFKSKIGTKQDGIMCVWWGTKLKLIDLDRNLVEDYNEVVHGKRDSRLALQG